MTCSSCGGPGHRPEGPRGSAAEPMCAFPTDPRDHVRDRSIIDQSSASYDPDCAGVGATYYTDATASRVFIPPAPTLGREPRYLFRLAAISCETGNAIRIRGLRQAIGLGCVLVSDDRDNPGQVALNMDQKSPFWRFPDANVCFGLRAIYGPAVGLLRSARRIAPGEGLDYASGTESVRLVASNGIIIPGNKAPAAGYFPGKPVGSLGLFRDLRFPWSSQGGLNDFDIELNGPVIIALYASVRQTDPESRQSLAALLPSTFVPPLPEDEFVVNVERAGTMPPVIYRYVSGSIIAEIGPQSRLPGINPVMGPAPSTCT